MGDLSPFQILDIRGRQCQGRKPTRAHQPVYRFPESSAIQPSVATHAALQRSVQPQPIARRARGDQCRFFMRGGVQGVFERRKVPLTRRFNEFSRPMVHLEDGAGC